jgi:predicted dehydrogenase
VSTIRTAIIGAGGIANYHLRHLLADRENTVVSVICEPRHETYLAKGAMFAEAGLELPPNEPDLEKLLGDYELDVALVLSPHAYHFEQSCMCLEAGIDVLLEKPMVNTAEEARELIAARDRSGKLLVVAFPGSLSPQIRVAAGLIASAEFGKLLSISAMAWQNWGNVTVDTWRQVPELSGGGFLFDTGAHMLNTVSDLAGQDFVEVAAWLDTCGRPVETMATVMGRLDSGALVTLHACGEAMPSCASDVRVFCERAIIHTGIWGEYLNVQVDSKQAPEPYPLPPSSGVWQQFCAVRAGTLANPSPPEIGLRMARLWDAIRTSALQRGQPVRIEQ